MVAITPTPNDLTLEIARRVEVNAPQARTFASIIENLGPLHVTPGGPCPMILEARPGGRWFRDLGNDAGHLWGHVQVVKPPSLLEITGPMFMSYAAISHIQYKVEPTGDDTSTILLRHQTIGMIDPKHREGVSMGWQGILDRIRDYAQTT